MVGWNDPYIPVTCGASWGRTSGPLPCHPYVCELPAGHEGDHQESGPGYVCSWRDFPTGLALGR